MLKLKGNKSIIQFFFQMQEFVHYITIKNIVFHDK